MKRFLKKRWHGIPIAVLALVLIAGVVAASYPFLSFTTVITVDEPLYVEYNLQGEYGGDSLWHELGDEDSLTIAGSAGDEFIIDLRINNRANSALTVSTTMSCDPVGGLGWFTFIGFPDGSVPASDGDDDVPEWGGSTTIRIHGDAPVGVYEVTINFTRS